MNITYIIFSIVIVKGGKMTTIFFDMDGTIADFYNVNGWLEYLNNSNSKPYKIAKPKINMQVLARRLNLLKTKGYKIGIISWLSRGGNQNFNIEVSAIKKKWLKKHLKSVNFDEIYICEYGTNKNNFINNEKDILFDDEKDNRESWSGIAYDETNILSILKTL